jgi:hypothetical protein
MAWSLASLFVVGICAVACFTLACVPRSNAAVSAADSAPATVRQPRTFLWAIEARKSKGDSDSDGDADASPVTYVLADDGTVLSQSAGIHVWAAGTEWSSEATEETVPTTPCTGGPDLAAQGGRGVRVRLVAVDGSQPPLELVAPSTDDQANEVDQSARLLASLGPYLFVEESTYAYTCGAHGNTGVSFAVWNVDERRKVDLLSDLPDRQALLAAGKRAIDARPDAVDFSRPQDPPTLTEILPRIGAHGHVEASALVSVPSCYACTDGGWSSYTVSTEVTTQLPWRLKALGQPPRAVGLFGDAHPGLTIGGYSRVP